MSKVVEVKSKWDYPNTNGWYWILEKESNDFIIAQMIGKIFFCAGNSNIEISAKNEFNHYCNDIVKWIRIVKPRNK